MYSSDAKPNFYQLFLQSSVSHDPSEKNSIFQNRNLFLSIYGFFFLIYHILAE